MRIAVFNYSMHLLFLHSSRAGSMEFGLYYGLRVPNDAVILVLYSTVHSRWFLSESCAFSHPTYICKRCHWQTSISATNHRSFFGVLGRHVCSPTQVHVTPARVRIVWGAFYDKSRTNTLRFYWMRYCEIGSSLDLSRTWWFITRTNRALLALQALSFDSQRHATWSLIGPTNVVISIL